MQHIEKQFGFCHFISLLSSFPDFPLVYTLESSIQSSLQRSHFYFDAVLVEPIYYKLEEPFTLSDPFRRNNTSLSDLSASHEESDRRAWVCCCSSHRGDPRFSVVMV